MDKLISAIKSPASWLFLLLGAIDVGNKLLPCLPASWAAGLQAAIAVTAVIAGIISHLVAVQTAAVMPPPSPAIGAVQAQFQVLAASRRNNVVQFVAWLLLIALVAITAAGGWLIHLK